MTLARNRWWFWAGAAVVAIAGAVWMLGWSQSGCGFSGCIPGGATNSVQYNAGGYFGGVGSGTATTVLHGNPSAPPSYSAVDLTADVINTLPLASLAAPGANQTLVSSGAAWVATSIPDCTTASGSYLNYAQSTGLFGCSAPVSPVLSGTTGSVGGSLLAVGGCSSGTASVPSATASMAAVASPNTYPGDGMWWDAQVTATGTVTVKVCAAIAAIPAASTYNVRVIR